LGTLVPVIGVVQIGSQQMADRYTYFPLIGVFIAVAWLPADLLPSGVIHRRLLPLLGTAIVLMYGAAAFHQTNLWRDNLVLLEHSRSCTADNFRIHQLLGTTLLTTGDLPRAIGELEEAVRLGPRSPAAHCALGIGLQEAGRLEEAMRQYEAALAMNEADSEAHCNLGILQLKRHDYHAAQRHPQRAIAVDPDNVIAYVNLSTLHLEAGHYAEALVASQQAVALDPTSVRGRHNFALALIARGRLDEAISQFQYLSRALPNDPETRANLERVLAMKRRSSTN
jgi:Flp pilus assembly protein TadD